MRPNSLVSVQRTAALRIASAFVVSALAVLVKAGKIPVDLLAEERTEICKAKSAGRYKTGHFREKTITKWQRRWNDEGKGRRMANSPHYYVTHRVTNILGNICTEWAKPPPLTVFSSEIKNRTDHSR